MIFLICQGVKSKTLHTAGMFLTGTWVVCSRGELARKIVSSSNNDVYVDIQYNTKMKKIKTILAVASAIEMFAAADWSRQWKSLLYSYTVDQNIHITFY